MRFLSFFFTVAELLAPAEWTLTSGHDGRLQRKAIFSFRLQIDFYLLFSPRQLKIRIVQYWRHAAIFKEQTAIFAVQILFLLRCGSRLPRFQHFRSNSTVSKV